MEERDTHGISFDGRLGWIEGQLDALKDQVEHVDSTGNSRFAALESRMDQGFREMSTNIDQHFTSLSQRTADLATQLATGHGMLSTVDRIMGWVVPCLIGGLVTLLLIRAGLGR
jgi:hypothetical protein